MSAWAAPVLITMTTRGSSLAARSGRDRSGSQLSDASGSSGATCQVTRQDSQTKTARAEPTPSTSS